MQPQLPAPLQVKPSAHASVAPRVPPEHWRKPLPLQTRWVPAHSLHRPRVVLQPLAPHPVWVSCPKAEQLNCVAPEQSLARLSGVKLRPSLQRAMMPPLQR